MTTPNQSDTPFFDWQPPDGVIEAAQLIVSKMKMDGHERFIIGGLCTRNYADELTEARQQLAAKEEELKLGHGIHNAACSELIEVKKRRETDASLIQKLHNEVKGLCQKVAAKEEEIAEFVKHVGAISFQDAVGILLRTKQHDEDKIEEMFNKIKSTGAELSATRRELEEFKSKEPYKLKELKHYRSIINEAHNALGNDLPQEIFGNIVESIRHLKSENTQLRKELETLQASHKTLINDYAEAVAGETEMQELVRLRKELEEAWQAHSAVLIEKDQLFDEAEKIRIEREQWRELARKFRVFSAHDLQCGFVLYGVKCDCGLEDAINKLQEMEGKE